MLRYLLPTEQPVVFCDSKEKVLHFAQRMPEVNITVNSIHGDITLKERNHIMKAFSQVLLSTFDCERDIEVEQQPLFVNSEVPTNHGHNQLRYGIPARFGPEGVSVRFANDDSIITTRQCVRRRRTDIGFRGCIGTNTWRSSS